MYAAFDFLSFMSHCRFYLDRVCIIQVCF